MLPTCLDFALQTARMKRYDDKARVKFEEAADENFYRGLYSQANACWVNNDDMAEAVRLLRMSLRKYPEFLKVKEDIDYFVNIEGYRG